jgi:hypothetical protein
MKQGPLLRTNKHFGLRTKYSRYGDVGPEFVQPFAKPLDISTAYFSKSYSEYGYLFLCFSAPRREKINGEYDCQIIDSGEITLL